MHVLARPGNTDVPIDRLVVIVGATLRDTHRGRIHDDGGRLLEHKVNAGRRGVRVATGAHIHLAGDDAVDSDRHQVGRGIDGRDVRVTNSEVERAVVNSPDPVAGVDALEVRVQGELFAGRPVLHRSVVNFLGAV